MLLYKNSVPLRSFHNVVKNDNFFFKEHTNQVTAEQLDFILFLGCFHFFRSKNVQKKKKQKNGVELPLQRNHI